MGPRQWRDTFPNCFSAACKTPLLQVIWAASRPRGFLGLVRWLLRALEGSCDAFGGNLGRILVSTHIFFVLFNRQKLSFGFLVFLFTFGFLLLSANLATKSVRNPETAQWFVVATHSILKEN